MKEKIIGIYKIQNIINGKMYIGLSSNIYKRWNIHKCILRKNMCKNQHLQYAWNKHGEESFIFSIIEQCEKQFLSEREKYYIKLFNTTNQSYGYNLSHGGQNPILSDETKLKMSQSHSKLETIQFDKDGNFIKCWPNIQQIKYDLGYEITTIRECCYKSNKNRKTAYGFIWIFKTDYELNGLDLEYYETREMVFNKVLQYNLNGELICEYDSIHKAGKLNNIPHQNIAECCKLKRKTAGGYVWKYKIKI